MMAHNEEAIAQNSKDIAVMNNEQQHFSEAITQLAKSNTNLADVITDHAERLGTLEKAQEIKGKFYKFINEHWWKIALAVIAIDKTYDIVRTIPHK